MGEYKIDLMVCFLALVMEASLQRRLKDLGSSVSYREVLSDLEQLRASRFEARGKAWLRRDELPGQSHEAFQAVGLRPPPRILTLS